MDSLRSEIRSFVRLARPEGGGLPVVHDEVREDGYTRKAVSYAACDNESISAFLFEPLAAKRGGALVVMHQHNSEWAIGKSEVAGLAGDPLQAFGPALARGGVTMLAPDAIGFESRCGQAQSLSKSHASADGWLQYYNHAMHRLVRGELLMTKILADAASAVSVLQQLASTDRVGIAGHSYGGNVALFAAALDTRIAFACASGAACSYRHKLAHGTGLEMALVIPGFASRFDVDDLMRCVAPRPLFVVSSDGDPMSADADDLVARARPAYAALDAADGLQHLRVQGPHALDTRRFNAIVEWLAAQASSAERRRWNETPKCGQRHDVGT